MFFYTNTTNILQYTYAQGYNSISTQHILAKNAVHILDVEKNMKIYRYFVVLLLITLLSACTVSGQKQVYLHNRSLEVRKYENSDTISGIVSSLENEIELTKEELKALEELAKADRVKIEYDSENNSIKITENENTEDEVITSYYPGWMEDGIARILPEPSGAYVMTTTLERNYCNVFIEISYSNALDYVSELKSCGFDNSSSMSEDGDIFTYTAYNDEDVYVEFYYALEMGSIELRR